jgi:polysaccharide biosynthesis transport protein
MNATALSVTSLARVLIARQKVIAAFTLTSIVAALLLVLMTPKTYVASTELIIDGKGQDPVNGQVLPARLLSGYIATQVDIILSRNVANKVIDTLQLTKTDTFPDSLRKEFAGLKPGDAPSRQALLTYLKERLTVIPKRDSSVLSISFKASDPELAAQLADAIAQAYARTNLELRTEPAKQITHWYEQQLAELRTNLVNKQNVLSLYQEEHHILPNTDRLDLENAKLSELSSMQILDNTQIRKLFDSLTVAQAKLAEQATQVGENHPQYRQTLGEVESIKREIQNTLKLASGGVRSSMELSQSRERQLEAEVAAQKQRVLSMGRSRNQLNLLEQEVENAQSAYDAALARMSQTQLESRVALTDIAVLNTASANSKPTSPKALMTLFLSMITGLLLGTATALCWEWIDRRIRGVEDLEHHLGLAVLAYIPSPKISFAVRVKYIFSREVQA